jgi:Zn-dependent protease/predicted transcriptional regulator
MKWSFKIGSVAGINVFLHVTFLLLMAWIGLSHFMVRQSWLDALGGVGFAICLFGIVVLHELGHALAARRYGIRTREITLLPIGGVARLERIPEQPMQELVVALAGPAVNVVLALLLLLALVATAGVEALQQARLLGGPFLSQLLWINVSLAVFNLVPAFPMDGGRVLRALLAMNMNYVRATNIAASIGQALAWVFGVIGLFINPFLIFIAFFVWMGAAQEANRVQMKAALEGVPVGRFLMKNFRALVPTDALTAAVEHILTGRQQDFPVVEEGRVVGLLTRSDLFGGLGRGGETTLVSEVMQRQFPTVGPLELVNDVMARLPEGEFQNIPVMQDGELVGMLSLEGLSEYLRMHVALSGRTAAQAEAPPPPLPDAHKPLITRG